MKIKADILRQKIEYLGYSQAKFARKSGVTLASLNAWLRGDRNAKAENVRKIAEFLQCPITEIAETEAGDKTVDIKTGNNSPVIGNTVIQGGNANSRDFRREAIDGIIDLDIDPAAKLAVLKFLRDLFREEKNE